MTGVQLIGREAVLKRFEASDCDAWALYQGKQFIVGGAGNDELTEWLESFEASGTTATYMIRFYQGEKPTSSTGNCDYVACMSFKLHDAYEGMGIAGHNSNLMQRLGNIEKQLKKQEEESDDDDVDLNSVIMGWLTDPAKLQQVAGAIRMFTGGSAAIEPASAVQSIGAVRPTAEVDQEANLTRIATALDILGAKDPRITEHLEKLAKLAQTDPDLFKSVVSKLDVL